MVNDARLLDFDDQLSLPSGLIVSRALNEKLSSASGDQLTDAVQTIQPDQYEQIASTTKPALIVQGAAGSGKSLIGLHRIDFILSPFSNVGGLTRPTAEQIIMFGPSPAFLKYVSRLLPGLGIHRVRQTTVSQWLLDQFSSRVTLICLDNLYDDLMNNRRKLTEAEIEAHSFKSGLRMKRLLDNYVSHLKREIRRKVGQSSGIRIPGSPPLELSATDLKEWVANVLKRSTAPNVARTYLVNDLSEEWLRLHPVRGVTRSESATEAGRLMESNLTLWPRIDLRKEYMDLVQSPDKILEYSKK